MKVKNSQLAASAVKKSQYPEEKLPQIALFGRSNAGKSSMINTIIQRRNLARTSSAPGKTRLVNFYRINGASDDGAQELSWYFVDLPGYGYAKAAKSERANWLNFLGEYLRSQEPKMCWQLVDIRHEPSREDVAMYEILQDEGWPVQVIANKVDKVSKNQRQKALALISRTLGITPADIICFSAVSGEGREKLQSVVEQYLLDNGE